MARGELIRFGDKSFDVRRYSHYRCTGDSLEIYFDNPRDVCVVFGGENVAAAFQEIEAVMDDETDSSWIDIS